MSSHRLSNPIQIQRSRYRIRKAYSALKLKNAKCGVNPAFALKPLLVYSKLSGSTGIVSVSKYEKVYIRISRCMAQTT